MTDTSSPTTWTIDSQSPRTKADSTGNVSEGYDVNFHTGEGHYGTVFVPMTRYTPDRVRAAVTELAAQLDAVGSMSSDD